MTEPKETNIDLSKKRLFQIVADEVYKDGVVEDWERKVLDSMARFLKLDFPTTKSLIEDSKARYEAGELGSSRPLRAPKLYAKAIAVASKGGSIDRKELQLLVGLRKLLGINEKTHLAVLDALKKHSESQATAEETAPKESEKSLPWQEEDKELPKDIESLEKAAANGVRSAQYHLSIKLLYGRGIEEDGTRARELLKLSADQQYPPAQCDLATMTWVLYNKGMATEEQLSEALELFQKTAADGLAEAQTTLGSMYLSGMGMKKDLGQAEHWLRKAADQGHKIAPYYLGKLLLGSKFDDISYLLKISEFGEFEMSPKEEEALRHLETAATAGHPDAQFRVGCMWHRPDLLSTQSIRWLHEAAAQGHMQAAQLLHGMKSKLDSVVNKPWWKFW